VSSLRVAGQPGVRRDRQGDRQQDNGSEHRRFHKLTISTECSNKSKMRRALRYSLCQSWCGQRHFNGEDHRRRVRSPDRISVGQVCFPQVTCFLPSEFCSKMYFGLFLLQCSLPSAKRSYYSFKLMSVRAFTRFAIGPIGRLTEPAE
jgi:hypothetical protein